MRISDWSSDVCSSDLDPYAAHIAEAPHRFGVPVAWIRAVMRVESAGRVLTISSAGAMGLMQVMPGTWAELRTRYGLGGDPYDARDNILAGTAYLREMHDRYRSEEHTSELQSLMRNSYAVFCL